MNMPIKQCMTLFHKELKAHSRSFGTLLAILAFIIGMGIPYFFPIPPYHAAVFGFRQYISRMPFIASVIFPVMSMTVWSDERKKGTEQLLFSLPVHDWALVLGKFVSLLAVFALMLVATIPVLVLSPVGIPPMGVLITSYMFLLLYASASLAITQFISSLTANPVISFLLSAFILVFLNFSQMLPYIAQLPATVLHLVSRLSFAWHLEASFRGIIDSRDIGFYLLYSFAFLLANRMQLYFRRHHP